MKVMVKLALAGMVALGLVTAAAAGEALTLEGKVVCAKCTLKRADAKECQNVLVVRDEAGKDVEYYVTRNAVDAEFGEVCTAVQKVTVTGTVSEKDGRKWITASKIVKGES
ncbi:MAG TPA: DUF6370 family protein [Vicinamibacteria bacterium]|nr:DUF6370 family protein [Vicinamibacteria bacterium]